MKAFLVETPPGPDYGLDGVFSTREKAQAYADAKNGIDMNEPDSSSFRTVREVEMDELASLVVKFAFRAVMAVKSGVVVGDWLGKELVHPDTLNDKWELGPGPVKLDRVWAESYVSAEHAVRLCEERRQDVLRRKASS